MGRRSYKKVTVNGEVILHQRYIYRGYLQIACCDLTRSNHPCLWLIMWDPTQPIATRPLAIQKDGTWYTYGLDLTKNVCEVFGTTGYIATTYTYSPYGEVTANGSVEQPIQWSSEFLDKETELVYYNYRYYSVREGAWISRDMIYERDLLNLYSLCKGQILFKIDYIGNNVVILVGGINADPYEHDRSHDNHRYNFYMAAMVKSLFINKSACNQIIEIIPEGHSYELRKKYDKDRIDNKDGPIVAFIRKYKQKAQDDYIESVFNMINNGNNRVYLRQPVNSKEDLKNALQTNIIGKKRTGKERISILYYYGHGSIGQLNYGANTAGNANNWSINIDDIPNIFSCDSFICDPQIGLITCHSASTSIVKEVNYSFAQVLSEHLRCRVKGIDGRANYEPTANVDMCGNPVPKAPTLGESIDNSADYKNGTREIMYDHGFMINNPRYIISN